MVLGGPCPGHYTIHCLDNGVSSPSRIAFRLYGEILAPFCAAAVLFVTDFGGLGSTVNLLVSWIRSAMLRPSSISTTRLRVLLVLDGSKRPSVKHIWFQISTKLLRQLRVSEPTKPYTFADLQKKSQEYMDLEVLPELPDDAFAEAVLARLEPGVGFSACHLQFFLRSAVRHFASQAPSTFNFVLASRKSIPLPCGWQDRMLEFVHSTRQTGIQHTSLIASALALNAFPPGMHHFAPNDVFTYAFEDLAMHLQRALRKSDFAGKVRQDFVEKASENFASGIPFAKAHLDTLGATSSAWASIISSNTCYFCLLRVPAYTLDCRHRICSSCIIICGELLEPWRYRVSRCPFCHNSNKAVFLLKPSTAGNRVLHLGGLTPENTLQFLADLRREIGLVTMPLREHFDVVVASDLGVFFAITMFLEDWTLDDCKHHLPGLKSPKYRRKGRVSFGRGLEWDLNEIKYFNGTNAVIIGNHKVYSNFLPISGSSGSNSIDTNTDAFGYSDLCARYDGGSYSTALLKSTSGRLIAAMFYLELLRVPTFHRSPQKCRAIVHCRIPPGNALLDLLSRLQQRGARITYRGDELGYTDVPLLEPAIIRRCRAGKPFRKVIEIKAYSMTTALDVKLDGPDRSEYNISHCPYELQQLVRDQGLDYVFGRPDHRPCKSVFRSLRGKRRLGSELDQAFLDLEKVLRDVCRS